MGDSLYVASSGAAARMKQLDIVANNLANVDTVGFRADRALFESALGRPWITAEGEVTAGANALEHVRTNGLQMSQASGPVTRTGAPLDVALQGNGFFSVELPDGNVAYTRAGSFRVDAEGTLVNQSGLPVLGGGGAITIGASAVTIQGDGNVVDAEGNSVGQLDVFEFENPGVLTKQGSNLFRAPDDAEPVAVDPMLAPGSLEQSNVQSVNELATLVILQRAFDASMQSLETSDELSQRLIRELSE